MKVSNLFSEHEFPSLGVLAQFYLLPVRWTPPQSEVCLLLGTDRVDVVVKICNYSWKIPDILLQVNDNPN